MIKLTQEIEEEIVRKLQSLGFTQVCTQEPTDEELEPEDDSNYPIEWADHVWKRDSDREFVVVSIPRCLTAAHKSLINIDASDAIALEMVEQSAE